jgi:heme oxygenase (biliverdin-IX-beta and delta-forming)
VEAVASLVLEQLRAATRPWHARLEDAIGLGRGVEVDEAWYRRHLARLLGWHAPLEEALRTAPAAPGLDAAAARRRAHLIADDLAALGMSAAEVAALPRCRDLPSLATPARVVGVLYVLEGAALGGARLHRALAERLPRVAARAGRFLHCHGDEAATRRAFGRFTALLDPATPADRIGEAALAAQDAFRSILAWFTS